MVPTQPCKGMEAEAAASTNPFTNAFVACSMLSNTPSAQTFPILSREHVNPGDAHPAYNSNPPTNGWHYPNWADWGIYADTIPDEYLIHNLEHGGIWISYRDSDNTELINQLQQLVSTDSDRVIMTHRAADDSAISVAAWGVLLNLDQFDAASIEAFIQKYRYQGPENVP